ncbi:MULTISPECIES: hypothetical protein [unclassified Yoonia]|uniref:hypothetical protein n=1 Tax=unclassified Yoonia TaxID=2629118 RepID=UPI002AFE7754|nr:MULTISPECIES: hypothetical protein [unclassified Yoonia]
MLTYWEDAAIRGWAQAYAPAREAVMRVDAQRMDFLRACLADMGPSQPQDAALIYAAHLGLEHLSLTTDDDPVTAVLRLIDMIAAPDQ